ncbi:TonB-dependent receptor [Aquipluma nitroreducens]|uniref:TonB-dependent receptor n=1 Tax=Aquipluma nitroreducens TaxID=2010828 RepID=A0A5K7S8L0_9BACT|nr:TonB-dependent receptor [Aquipluma nitroreducens]BBE17825.1 TonB-dependent receptor [Aquipluma nitroreducens]
MRFSIILFIVLLPYSLFAQQRRTISGYITDAQTGEQLYAATIFEQNSQAGTTSNRFGFFSLSLPEGLVNLKISFVGYISQSRTISLKADTFLEIALKSDNKLEEVVVKGNSGSLANSVSLGHVKISSKGLGKLPSLMGEKDLMKSITILPGVQQGSEGSSGIFVRGGSPDQNLILLDDVPLFNVSHLFGFVSVFTPEAINSIDFYKGAFPARYGGRLSSVIDLRMKDGNKFKRESSLTLGPISSQFTTEGPIQKGKSSYFFSVRRTLFDLIFQGISKLANADFEGDVIPFYAFHDISGKINFRINEKNHLYWSFYSGNDKLSFDYINHTQWADGKNETQRASGTIQWGNLMTALKLNTRINSRMFLNTTLSGSLFNYGNLFAGGNETIRDNITEKNDFSFEYLSQIQSFGIKSDLDIYGNTDSPVQTGVFTSMNNYLPGRQIIKRNDGSDENASHKISGIDYGFYVDKKFRINSQTNISAGLRNVFQTIVNQKTYFAFEPRLSANWRQNDQTNFEISYALMTQTIHLLSNGNIGLPTDIWVPSTRQIRPETSHILSAGMKKTLTNSLKLSVEGYYKRLNHVISFAEGQGVLDVGENWEGKIISGKGRAWGIENELRYSRSKIESWISYTLAWNERKFTEMNRNRWFPYVYDRRHKIDSGVIWQISKGWSASATWTFQSGAPATYSGLDYSGYPNNLSYSVSDFLTGNAIDASRIQYYKKINGVRLPAYHRLDLGFTREWGSSEKRRALSISIYNVYNRMNPYLIYTKAKPNGTVGMKQFTLFPIIPSISYRVSF